MAIDLGNSLGGCGATCFVDVDPIILAVEEAKACLQIRIIGLRNAIFEIQE